MTHESNGNVTQNSVNVEIQFVIGKDDLTEKPNDVTDKLDEPKDLPVESDDITKNFQHAYRKGNDKTNDVILIENSLGQLDLHVYRRRWYILLLFSLLSFFQGGVWNQWGPVAAVSEGVYGWSDGVIALFANWGPIAYIPTALLWSWVLDTKGLRVSVVTAVGLVTAGVGLRCLVRTDPAFTWLVHVGQILNGISGPVAMGGVPKLSAVWFPPSERATATAFSYVMAGIGIGLTFLLGPIIVVEKPFDDNCTLINSSMVHQGLNTTLPCKDEILEIQRGQIMYYMYGTFALCGALFLTVLIYFPNEPPKPPSPSASTPRLDYLQGLKQLVSKARFWQIGLAYGIAIGTRDAWSSMLGVNLKDHNISQSEAGWLGFYGTLAGTVSGIAAGRFADGFQRRFRILLVVITTFTNGAYIWLVLLILGYIPESKASMYSSFVLSSLAGGALSPLFYELVCETAYPVSEGITNICLTSLNNVAGLIFLGVLSVPDIGTVWMNWLLVSAYAVALVLLILLPEGHNRLDIDLKGELDLSTGETRSRQENLQNTSGGK